jgi:AcrR family transcriptional regulator
MPRPPARPAGEKSTREQILDVALDLFTTEGFEKTSLREIAERMGFSKAALYYHFASKDDILLALHLRLHELGRAGFEQIDWDRVAPGEWPSVLDEYVELLLENRELFLLHIRNHSSLERLGHTHDSQNKDLLDRLRWLLTDERVPRGQRLRLAFAFGVLAVGLVASGEIFEDFPTDALRVELRSAVRDLLAPAVGERPGDPRHHNTVSA